MKKITQKFRLLVIMFLAFQLCLVSSARADDSISVKSGGKNVKKQILFDADNIYPGWKMSKTVRIKNKSNDKHTDLYFVFDVKGDKKLASKLKLYVTRLGGNKSVRIGGPGDRFTLRKANDKKLYTDRLRAGKGKTYQILIKFDKDAGNEYQGLSTKFDIDFGIEEIIGDSRVSEEVSSSQGRVAPEEDLSEEETTAVLGENTPTIPKEGSEAEVMGVTKECKNTEKKPWVLALIAFTAILLLDSWRKFKADKYSLISDLILLIAFIAIWYFLDTCRILRWVPSSAIAIGVGVHFGYVKFLSSQGKKSLPFQKNPPPKS